MDAIENRFSFLSSCIPFFVDPSSRVCRPYILKIADNPKVEKAYKDEDKTVLNISSKKTWAELIRQE
jgi:hypothetical protein